MLQQLLRRLAATLAALWAVSLIIFVLLDVAPGDAAASLVGDSASQEQLEIVRHEMGLDRSWPDRYATFVGRLLANGDLGESLITGHKVSDLLLACLPHTLLLAFVATGLSALGGSIIGALAALHSGGWLDTIVMGLTTLGLAIPSFWSALLLVMLFSLQLGWLPVVGAGSAKQLILPTLTLALPSAAVIARLMRSSLLDELHAPYVRTARAKGLPSRLILWRHILRSSFLPVLTLLGLQLGHLLGGAFIVETIFAWPGLGRLTVQAVFDRDVPVVMGAALLVAAIYLLINLAVDLIHGWLDPRVAQRAL